jgi:Winged helix DNA-binding domain
MEETLSRRHLNRALLARQMLLAKETTSPLRVIERLIGLQAQQARPPFAALWTRIAGFEREQLLRLLQSRKVVRSTTLRGTLHLMSASDYLALRATLQPMLTAGMRAVLRDRATNLDIDALVTEARRFFEQSPRTFTELRACLMKAFPAGDERAMGYAVRTHLPLVVVPEDAEWGFRADADWAVAESWLGQPLSADQQPDALVLRYLAAFGPATASDVQAWSGLSGLQVVLETLRPKLRVFRDERKRELFDLPKAPRPLEESTAPVRFLPDFDNVILAHADRTRIIADEHRPRVVTRNFLVLPTFLLDGFVAGTWKTTLVKKTATLVVTPFAPLPKAAKSELTSEGGELLRFIERGAEQFVVRFEPP